MKRYAQQGFTLVEIAIVLVIIGLLVGGVMVGKDLISGGEVAKQAAQISQYKTAVSSFRDKYNGLPGDLTAATANRFQMITRSGTAGHGDGNGFIEGCAYNARNAGCETLLFWTDLSFAGLISPSLNAASDAPKDMASLFTPPNDWQQVLAAANAASFNPISDAHAVTLEAVGGCTNSCICFDPVSGTTNSVGDTSPDCDCAGMCGASPAPSSNKKENFIPRASLGGDNSVADYTDGNSNYFQITGIIGTDTDGVYSLRNGVSPLDASALDVKLDDGIPMNGVVRAMGGANSLGVAAIPGPGNCVSDAAGNPYNTRTDELASSPLCQVSIRMQ